MPTHKNPNLRRFFWTLVALCTPTFALSEGACPEVSLPDDVEIVSLAIGGTTAVADVHYGDPNMMLGVVDLFVDKGPGKIFLIAESRSAVVWRISGDTRRIRGGLFASGRALNFPYPKAPASVVGLPRYKVILTEPESCDLDQGHYRRSIESVLKSIVGRDADRTVSTHVRTAKITLSDVIDFGSEIAKSYRPSPQKDTEINLAAAKLWREFIWYFPGGYVDIDPTEVVSLEPVFDYASPPGLLGLGEAISRGQLELTNIPSDVNVSFELLGDDWKSLDAWKLDRLARSAPGHAKLREWWSDSFGRQWIYGPEDDLNGNSFRFGDAGIQIQLDNGEWIDLDLTVELIVRGEFTVPPATPSRTHAPMFLLPEGVARPNGQFDRQLPLLTEQ